MREDLDEIEETPKKSFFDRFKKEPKGVDKDEPRPSDNPNVENFFKSTFRNLNRMLAVNMFLIFGNFPIFFGLLALSGYVSLTSHAPYFQLFSAIKGVSYIVDNPVTSSLMSIFGQQAEISVNTIWTYIMFGLACLTFFTFGLVNCGTTHIMRSLFRGDPIFIFSDFFSTIKKNLKQGIIFGIIDLGLLLMLVYDIFYFNTHMSESMFNSILFYLSIVMVIFYLFMRLYIYLMIITFDLSLPKIIKNSVIFAMAGVKRNLMWLVGIIIIAAIEFLLLSIFAPLAVILPFIGLLGIIMYMGVYCAYPKIKELMIDPYYANNNDKEE